MSEHIKAKLVVALLVLWGASFLLPPGTELFTTTLPDGLRVEQVVTYRGQGFFLGFSKTVVTDPVSGEQNIGEATGFNLGVYTPGTRAKVVVPNMMSQVELGAQLLRASLARSAAETTAFQTPTPEESQLTEAQVQEFLSHEDEGAPPEERTAPAPVQAVAHKAAPKPKPTARPAVYKRTYQQKPRSTQSDEARLKALRAAEALVSGD